MKKYIFAAALGLLPVAAFAQEGGVNTSSFNSSVQALTHSVNLIIPLLLAVAVVFFIYGVIKYIIAGGPEEAGKARGYIIWSIVGLAVILAIWGIARVLIGFFGLDTSPLNTFPGVNTSEVPAAQTQTQTQAQQQQ